VSPSIHHVYKGSKHLLKGPNCPCKPDIYLVCDCSKDPTCWKCQGEGIVEVEKLDFDSSFIIVHRET
jgi:hypothetical protein